MKPFRMTRLNCALCAASWRNFIVANVFSTWTSAVLSIIIMIVGTLAYSPLASSDAHPQVDLWSSRDSGGGVYAPDIPAWTRVPCSSDYMHSTRTESKLVTLQLGVVSGALVVLILTMSATLRARAGQSAYYYIGVLPLLIMAAFYIVLHSGRTIVYCQAGPGTYVRVEVPLRYVYWAATQLVLDTELLTLAGAPRGSSMKIIAAGVLTMVAGAIAALSVPMSSLSFSMIVCAFALFTYCVLGKLAVLSRVATWREGKREMQLTLLWGVPVALAGQAAIPVAWLLAYHGLISADIASFTFVICEGVSKCTSAFTISSSSSSRCFDEVTTLVVEEKSRAVAAIGREHAMRGIMRYLFHELRVPLNSIVLGLGDSNECLEDVAIALDELPQRLLNTPIHRKQRLSPHGRCSSGSPKTRSKSPSSKSPRTRSNRCPHAVTVHDDESSPLPTTTSSLGWGDWLRSASRRVAKRSWGSVGGSATPAPKHNQSFAQRGSPASALATVSAWSRRTEYSRSDPGPLPVKDHAAAALKGSVHTPKLSRMDSSPRAWGSTDKVHPHDRVAGVPPPAPSDTDISNLRVLTSSELHHPKIKTGHDLAGSVREVQGTLASSHAAALGLGRLLDDFLSLDKIEQGHLMVEMEPFHVRLWMQQSISLLRPSWQAKEIQVYLKVDDRVPDYAVADRHKLRQCLCNFLSNAIKFSPVRSRVMVRCSIVYSAKPFVVDRQQTFKNDEPVRELPVGGIIGVAEGPHMVLNIGGSISRTGTAVNAPESALTKSSSGYANTTAVHVLPELQEGSQDSKSSGSQGQGKDKGGARHVNLTTTTSSDVDGAGPHSMAHPSHTSSGSNPMNTSSGQSSDSEGSKNGSQGSEGPLGLILRLAGQAVSAHSHLIASSFPPHGSTSGSSNRKNSGGNISGYSADAHSTESGPEGSQSRSHTLSSQSQVRSDGVYCFPPPPDSDEPGPGLVPFLRISVMDRGVGISEEEISKLFTPFQQIRAGAQQKGNGTGLGLAIVKQMIALCGGTVGVKSQVQKGSIFHFQVPVDGTSVRASLVSGDGVGAAQSAAASEQSSPRSCPLPVREHEVGGSGVIEIDNSVPSSPIPPIDQAAVSKPNTSPAADIISAGSCSGTCEMAMTSSTSNGPSPPLRTSESLRNLNAPELPGWHTVISLRDSPFMSTSALADGSCAGGCSTRSNGDRCEGDLRGMWEIGGGHEISADRALVEPVCRVPGIPFGEKSRAASPSPLPLQHDMMVAKAVAGAGAGADASPFLLPAHAHAHLTPPPAFGQSLGLGLSLNLSHHVASPTGRTNRGLPEGGGLKATSEHLTPLRCAVVVDDVASNRLFLARLLARRGVTKVMQAADGCEAVELAEKLASSRSLLDVQAWFFDQEMPGMNGSEAISLIRGLGVKAFIVSVTGNALEEDQKALLKSGADCIFTKPLRLERLEVTLMQAGLCFAIG